MKIVHQNLLLPLEALLKGVLRMREVVKMSMDLRIASEQSLMMGF